MYAGVDDEVLRGALEAQTGELGAESSQPTWTQSLTNLSSLSNSV